MFFIILSSNKYLLSFLVLCKYVDCDMYIACLKEGYKESGKEGTPCKRQLEIESVHRTKWETV